MKLPRRAPLLLLCLTLAACSSREEKPEAPSEASAAAVEPVLASVDPAWLARYEQQLRDGLKGSAFEVERRGDDLVVVAPVGSSFNPDRPGMLLPATLGPITRVAKLLEHDGETAVLILGHADSADDAASSRPLSRERAGAFGAIFRLSGLKGDRLVVRGMGADLPLASGDSEEARARNRRVEMLLTPQPRFAQVVARYPLAVPGASPEATPPRRLAALEKTPKE